MFFRLIKTDNTTASQKVYCMSDKTSMTTEHKKELEEMVNTKKQTQPVEKVLSIFCQRHGVTMDSCRVYYKQLVKEGKVKEE
jgi:hypothetical protein